MVFSAAILKLSFVLLCFLRMPVRTFPSISWFYMLYVFLIVYLCLIFLSMNHCLIKC